MLTPRRSRPRWRRPQASWCCAAARTGTSPPPDGRARVFQGGGPGLGVSGSGDVQAGIVAGLLARGAAPDQAAVWAAYIHGRAGERLAAATGVVGALAREQFDQVPRVLAEIG
ncbi:MAG: hypothetical protein GEU96_20235 [Propionibacteriales bacterium]|nr:hypothetical protein [Propionibacteriales bacterium]